MSTKTCQTCGETKPVELFKKSPTRFGGDGWSKACKSCGLAAQRARREQRAADSGSQEASDETPATATLVLDHSLGFRAELVKRDICITQGDGKQQQSVWLSLCEFAALARWVNRAIEQAETPTREGQT